MHGVAVEKDGMDSMDACMQVYGNEAQVGEAVRTCGLPREDIFVTSKVRTRVA